MTKTKFGKIQLSSLVLLFFSKEMKDQRIKRFV